MVILMMFLCVDIASYGVRSVSVFLELFGSVESLCQVRRASCFGVCEW